MEQTVKQDEKSLTPYGNYVSPLEGFTLTTEKPKHYKHKDLTLLIILVTSESNNLFDGIVVKCLENSTVWKVGEIVVNYEKRNFEPCDYTPSLNDLIEKDRQANQNKPFCGFEFTPEPVEVSPETEQPKSNAYRKFVSQYVYELEQENAELKAQLAAKNEKPNKAIEILKTNQL